MTAMPAAFVWRIDGGPTTAPCNSRKGRCKAAAWMTLVSRDNSSCSSSGQQGQLTGATCPPTSASRSLQQVRPIWRRRPLLRLLLSTASVSCAAPPSPSSLSVAGPGDQGGDRTLAPAANRYIYSNI
eukprot:4547503-Pleurochrysis_carterae.AAC.2